MNEFDHRRFFNRCLSSSEKGLKTENSGLKTENSGLNGDSKPVICDAGAVLHQFRYHANW